MRAIYFFIIITFSLFIGACGDDDDRICIQSDFIGNYEGPIVCANGGAIQGAMASISAGSTENELEVILDGIEFTAEVVGCNFTGSVRDGNADLVYEGNLNGDEIEVTTRGLVFGNVFDCTLTGERQ